MLCGEDDVKITIVSFQKQARSPYAAAEAEFAKRLSRHARIELQSVKSWNASTGLPDKALGAGYPIGLFVDGKAYNSRGLADRVQELMNRGQSHLMLVIGGAEGIPARAAEQVKERWSLSPLTLPHQLVRLVLLEALYRSFDMLHGGKYHK